MPSIRSLVGASSAVFLAAFVQLVVADTYEGATNSSAIYPDCPDPSDTCSTYGVDFHDGGVYFQNSNSTADFTFASRFNGK